MGHLPQFDAAGAGSREPCHAERSRWDPPLGRAHTIAIGNTSSRNGGAGIWLYDPNCAHLNFFRLGSNLTDGNEGLGIDVELPGGCTPEITPFDLLDAGGNAANRNGDPRECTIYVECGRNRGQANKLMPLDPAAMPERHAGPIVQ